jgi:prenyl protein peptidase
MSLGKVIVLSPIIFGLAHIHHFYEFRITHPGVPIIAAVARSILQLTYTTLFGAYATFLFVRTGSLVAVIAVHAFCNSMGLPRVWGRVQPYWIKGGPESVHRDTMVATVVYYVLLIGGLVLWWTSLGSLTESNGALVPTVF